jgi:hypothetical protein
MPTCETALDTLAVPVPLPILSAAPSINLCVDRYMDAHIYGKWGLLCSLLIFFSVRGGGISFLGKCLKPQ